MSGVPNWLERAWRQAADRAAGREPADETLYVVHDEREKLEGRPKRGRLADPDRKSADWTTDPPGWAGGGGAGDEPIGRMRF